MISFSPTSSGNAVAVQEADAAKSATAPLTALDTNIPPITCILFVPATANSVMSYVTNVGVVVTSTYGSPVPIPPRVIVTLSLAVTPS